MQLRTVIAIALCVALSAQDSSLSAQVKSDSLSWKFLRGSNFDAVVKGAELAESWPDTGPPVLWSRKLGQGYSSFVGDGQHVYTQYQSVLGQFVICLDALTGKTVWQHRYGWAYESAGVYPGPRSTPTMANGGVFYATPSGLVGCLDAKNGKSIWSLNLKEKFNGKGTDFGYASTPVVTNNLVILPVGGKGASMVALNTNDGSIAWKSGDDPASYTPAIPISLGGKLQVLGYLENALVGYDLLTGSELWRLELSEGYDEHSAWPIYREPYLWISGPFRSGSRLLKLTNGDDNVSVDEVWRSSTMSNDVVSSVLFENHIYGFDLFDVQAKTHRTSRGIFRCVDFLTGEVQWSNGDGKLRRSPKHDPANPIIGHTSVRVAEGKLLLFNDTGELIMARATPNSYEELGRVELLGGEIVWTPPALIQNRLYVRNHSVAACVFMGMPEKLEPEQRAIALTATDISQNSYGHLASIILPVEREYVFDVPTMEVFIRWFAASTLLLCAAATIAGSLHLLACGLSKNAESVVVSARPAFWILAIIVGALGTSILGHQLNQLLFTWPVCLYAVFEALVFHAQLEKPNGGLTRMQIWMPRLLITCFAAVCLAYFLLCRRLSLVFEWSFLVGFPMASPFIYWARKISGTAFRYSVAKWMLTGFGFAAFYWAGVGLLAIKYQIQWR